MRSHVHKAIRGVTEHCISSGTFVDLHPNRSFLGPFTWTLVLLHDHHQKAINGWHQSKLIQQSRHNCLKIYPCSIWTTSNRSFTAASLSYVPGRENSGLAFNSWFLVWASILASAVAGSKAGTWLRDDRLAWYHRWYLRHGSPLRSTSITSNSRCQPTPNTIRHLLENSSQNGLVSEFVRYSRYWENLLETVRQP